MSILVRISNTDKRAESIINMIKTLADDYDFIEIIKKSEEFIELKDNKLSEKPKYTAKKLKEKKGTDDKKSGSIEQWVVKQF